MQNNAEIKISKLSNLRTENYWIYYIDLEN